MTDKILIPPSPSEDDYVRQVSGAEAPPLLSEADPFALFNEWLAEAVAREANDANAMSLATVDADGLPDVRMVLLKDADRQGFVFYSNVGSAKETLALPIYPELGEQQARYVVQSVAEFLSGA